MEFNGIDYSNESDFLDAIEEHECREEFGKMFRADCARHEKTVGRDEKEKTLESRRANRPASSALKLGEIVSRGLGASSLLDETRASSVTPAARALLLGEATESFPLPSPIGERFCLGAVCVSEMGEDRRVGEEMSARGLSMCHPEAALYLLDKYPCGGLKDALNKNRPKGAPEITMVVIWHRPLVNRSGSPRYLVLDLDFLLSGQIEEWHCNPGSGWFDDMVFVGVLRR